VDVDAGTLGLVLTGGVAAALGLHGIASLAREQMRPKGEELRGGPTEIAERGGLVEREGPPEK
jgi:hypothetical protein